MPTSRGSGLLTTKGPAKPHLAVPGSTGGLGGEISDLRADLVAELSAACALVVEEFTNPPAADPDGIKLAIATVAAPVTYSGAQLDGVVGGGTLDPPRNITVTTAGGTAADAPATADINGLDVNGKALSETITVAQTATIANGVKAFSKVTSIVLPAADGTDATLAFGFGLTIGLGKKIKVRAGIQSLIKEHADGAVVTNGVLASPATSPPNGSYTPNAAPDAAKDYAIYYEQDATVVL